MTDEEINDENKQMLKAIWCKLRSGVPPVSLGLTVALAETLVKLEETQVNRAADVNVPIFEFACTSETLKQAFDEKSTGDSDQYIQQFLVNRWRVTAVSLLSSQVIFGLSQNMYSVLRNATFTEIMRSAASGIQIVKMAIRPAYLFHAGTRFDLHTSHRTQLALCNTIKDEWL